MNEHFSGHHEHRHNRRNSIVGGLILVALGAIFLIQQLTNVKILGYIWPVFLILIGLAIIFSRLSGTGRR